MIETHLLLFEDEFSPQNSRQDCRSHWNREVFLSTVLQCCVITMKYDENNKGSVIIINWWVNTVLHTCMYTLFKFDFEQIVDIISFQGTINSSMRSMPDYIVI